jgi:hypothetical protein
MISRDFFSVANNLGDSVAFNLESDTTRRRAEGFHGVRPGWCRWRRAISGTPAGSRRRARREVEKSPGQIREVQPCGHVIEVHGFCFAFDPPKSPALSVWRAGCTVSRTRRRQPRCRYFQTTQFCIHRTPKKTMGTPQEQQSDPVAAWKALWPNHCKACGG